MSLADLTRAEHHLPDDPPETDHTPAPPPDWQTLDQHLPDPVTPGSALERYYATLTLAA